MTAQQYHQTTFRLGHASDAEYIALATLHSAMREDFLPDDPPRNINSLVDSWRSIPDFVTLQVWAIWDGDRIVAATVLQLADIENYHQRADIELDVHRDYRQQGLATRLLHAVNAKVQEGKREILIGSTMSTVPAGAAFAHHIGAVAGLEMKINQLMLAELDQQLVAQWLQDSATSAERFEIGMWEGAYPEEELAGVARLLHLVNDQPHDDLDIEPIYLTPEQVREIETANLADGTKRWTCYVRERATGEFAGFSEILWHEDRPKVVRQGNTGVFEHYRGQKLGRWLKAYMLDFILKQMPYATMVRTTNANSNAPMLKINTELGFKPYMAQTTWQLDASTLAEFVARHPLD